MRQIIERSVRLLQINDYTSEQREAALATIFRIDEWLIRDRTYFVAERGDTLLGFGAWSGRCASFEDDHPETREILDPKTEPARIRAFFVDPEFARQGIATALLRHCEEALQTAGYRSAHVIATVTGEPLYTTHGYSVIERYDIPTQFGRPFPVVSLEKRFTA